MHNPLVSVIIVNWNGMRFLKDCLGSLSKSTYKNTEILFVDNASVDDSVGFVKKNFPKITIYKNSKNLGFAGGHEVAYKNVKGEVILLLSMDTIIEKNVIQELVNTLESDSSIGAVQPKLLMYPEKDLIDSVGSFFLLSGLLYHYGYQKNHTLAKYNKQMDVYSAKGACILFRKSTLDKTGLFDKDYFAYFEETDLCHRIWLAGYRVVYSPKAIVYHTGGGASKKMVPSFIQFHSYKNRICTYLKNLSLKYLLIVFPSTIAIYEATSLLFLVKLQFSLAWALQRAILWNIMHLPETIKKRKFIQSKIRVVSDDQFLPKIMKPVRLSYYFLFLSSFRNYKD